MADNLKLYNAVRSVPQEACKGFSNGSFSGTDINPMWRIKTLTEQFGYCGVGWYIDEVDRWTETVEGEQLVFVKIHLFIKVDGEWSKPIVGIGGNKTLQIFPAKNGKPEIRKVSDESYKMALTDAISVACKHLGFGGDIYWQNDPTKYARYYNEQPQEQPTPSDKPSGRGRKKETAPVQQPVQEDMPQELFQPKNGLETLQVALGELAMVGSAEQLTEVWNRYAPMFSQNAEFVKAVQNHPYNPNHKGV